MFIRKYANKEAQYLEISNTCKTDKGFLLWVVSRLVHQHGDKEFDPWIQRLIKLAQDSTGASPDAL